MQVKSDKCGQHEEGNAISFGDLDAHAGPSLGFRKAVLPMIYAQIADAVLAARKELLGSLRQQGRGRRVCALLGYDFMVALRSLEQHIARAPRQGGGSTHPLASRLHASCAHCRPCVVRGR